jgi:pilus assembly protein CpaF
VSIDAFGPLATLFADPDVSEIMVNGASVVWFERHGAVTRSTIVLAPGQADHMVERVVAPLGLRFDLTSPIVDARLPDGTRLHAVGPPVAIDGTSVSIRRFARRPLTLDSFAGPATAAMLIDAVTARANIVVSGATSSGKTSLLNALAAHIPGGERVITIEDAAELRLPSDHVVRLEARRATADGLGRVDIRDLVRAALRMRPDRLVIGEVRGAEALDMIQALNTGHDGSFTTVHANSALDALHRIDTMALQAASGLPVDAIGQQVHRSIDLVVHVARGLNGHRRISSVSETAPVLREPRLTRIADWNTVFTPLQRRRIA